jgi:hypothetical protein
MIVGARLTVGESVGGIEGAKEGGNVGEREKDGSALGS